MQWSSRSKSPYNEFRVRKGSFRCIHFRAIASQNLIFRI